LTLLLGLFGLLSTRPWESDSLAPKLEVPVGLGADLGDAVEVVPAGGPGVASAEVAPAGPAARLAGPLVVSKRGEDEQGPSLAVSPARAVVAGVPTTTPAPTPVPAQPPATPVGAGPVAVAPQPAPAAEPAPTAPPLVAGVGGGSPGTSGLPGPPKGPEAEPEESCEGDEYVITVGAETDTSEGESAQFEIVVRRIGADGSESEFELEGDLSAVDALAELLTAEGNCVQTVFEPAASVEAEEEPVSP
jgi:hypothetical protein